MLIGTYRTQRVLGSWRIMLTTVGAVGVWGVGGGEGGSKALSDEQSGEAGEGRWCSEVLKQELWLAILHAIAQNGPLKKNIARVHHREWTQSFVTFALPWWSPEIFLRNLCHYLVLFYFCLACICKTKTKTWN